MLLSHGQNKRGLYFDFLMGKEGRFLMSDIFEKMAAAWPSAVVARAEVRSFTGGGISEKTLANCDSQGEGPGKKIMIGRRVCYEKLSLIDWLRERASMKAQR